MGRAPEDSDVEGAELIGRCEGTEVSGDSQSEGSFWGILERMLCEG